MIGKTAILLVALAAVIAAIPAANKPETWLSKRPIVHALKDPPPSSRIVGGEEATPHSFPHQAALYIDNMYFCGGSLISNEWILTAAHCMDGAKSVKVTLGAHNIGQNEPTQVTMTSHEFMVHEHWDSFTLKDDIAVIKLPHPVTFNEYIKPVGLPSDDVLVGTVVTPSGWGKTSDNAAGTSYVLRRVYVPVIETGECKEYYGSYVTAKHICTSAVGGHGTCNGDSGGPLNYNGKTYGITSFVAAAGCESGHPDAFTRVTSYLDWIQEKTGVTP